MNSSAILTLLVIGSFIWGGLAFLLSIALRREGEKTRSRGD